MGYVPTALYRTGGCLCPGGSLSGGEGHYPGGISDPGGGLYPEWGLSLGGLYPGVSLSRESLLGRTPPPWTETPRRNMGQEKETPRRNMGPGSQTGSNTGCQVIGMVKKIGK